MSTLFSLLQAGLLLGAITLASPLIASESTLYRQTFDIDVPTSERLVREIFSSKNWELLYSLKGGAIQDGVPPGGSYYIGVFNHRGASEDGALSGEPEIAGFGQIYHADGQAFKVLLFTEEITADRETRQAEAISWYACGTTGGNNSPARAAVRIGSQWYVSAPKEAKALERNQPQYFSKSARKEVVTLTSGPWFVLRAEPGSPFEIDESPVFLPEEPIEAFGLYIVPRQENGAYYLFDSFEVTGYQN